MGSFVMNNYFCDNTIAHHAVHQITVGSCMPYLLSKKLFLLSVLSISFIDYFRLDYFIDNTSTICWSYLLRRYQSRFITNSGISFFFTPNNIVSVNQ